MRSFTPHAPTALCQSCYLFDWGKYAQPDRFHPIFPIRYRSACSILVSKSNPKRLESTLSLFVLGIVTDNSDDALSLDNLALFAHRLNRRPNFHCYSFLLHGKKCLEKGIICPLHKKTDLYYSTPRFKNQAFFIKDFRHSEIDSISLG